MGSRPSVSSHDIFFGANVALGSVRELLPSPTTEAVATYYVKSTFCGMLQSDQEMVHCCYIK